jgi:predicted DNA-binding protein (MmcQ/YjbR family)
MSHFDKVLERYREICLALPEASEKTAWGHPTFRAGKKMFSAIGQDYEGGWSIGFRVGLDRQAELLKDDRFYPTPYAAHQGWISLRLGRRIDWAEVKSLAIESYRFVAMKRMLKKLDELQP